ncbi:MAG: prepilin-type N-terminal cleavage/methylation domain-containing protein [Planctomycetaceae bacterium]|jgi:type II secretory pathway pseudopilin PulG|nr:prepilin-type N-terminal cleavage/methylation domain-containing protein [Planctomycetaceae bacterium]
MMTIAFHVRRGSGFTLLEILISLVVLLLGLGVLVRITQTARSQSELSHELSTVQQVCQSRMNEMMAGSLPLQTIMEEPIPDLPDWTLSVSLDTLRKPGIVAVTVSARCHQPGPDRKRRRAGRYGIVRWVNIAEPQPRTVSGGRSMSSSGGTNIGTAGENGLPSSGDVRGGTLESLFSNPRRTPRTSSADTGERSVPVDGTMGAMLPDAMRNGGDTIFPDAAGLPPPLPLPE